MAEKQKEVAHCAQQTSPPILNQFHLGRTAGIVLPVAPATYGSRQTESGVYPSGAAMATTAVPSGPPNAVHFPVLQPHKKSLLEAYLLCLSLGVLGAHHFYLGRPGFGVLYFLTFGLLGCGWVLDMVRLPFLVQQVNRRNKERAVEMARVQQQGLPGTVYVCAVPEPRNLADAYVLWFPLGLLGAHHFYLRNYGFGVLYLFTFGLLGFGWLIDLFRMPYLVKAANETTVQREYCSCTAHILTVSPAGLLGGHYFYLNRPVWGLLYILSFGIFGVGWIVDWFRVPILVRRANSALRGETDPEAAYVDDAYLLWFPPLGVLGLHHYYLRRPCWGVLYTLTLGLLGLGWIADLFRLSCMVRDYNSCKEEARRRLVNRLPPGGAVVGFYALGDNEGVMTYPAHCGYPAGGQVIVSVTQLPATAPLAGDATALPSAPHAAGIYGYPGYQSGAAYGTEFGCPGPYTTCYTQPGNMPPRGADGFSVVYPPAYTADRTSPPGQPVTNPPSYEASVMASLP